MYRAAVFSIGPEGFEVAYDKKLISSKQFESVRLSVLEMFNSLEPRPLFFKVSGNFIFSPFGFRVVEIEINKELIVNDHRMACFCMEFGLGFAKNGGLVCSLKDFEEFLTQEILIKVYFRNGIPIPLADVTIEYANALLRDVSKNNDIPGSEKWSKDEHETFIKQVFYYLLIINSVIH